MLRTTHRRKATLAVGLTLMPLSALPAFADQIEEIVITAQKRAERLQDAPLAVTALNADAIQARGIQNARDLSALAPNLTVGSTTAGAGDMTISMRGLPAADTLLSNDNPVAIYIDGVIQARLAGGLLDLVDLDRVEVLRGPQGTLYGRNTTGGAVNFITKRPSDEFQVSQKLGYGTQDHFSSRTTVDTGKIGETGLKANLSFLYNKQKGYFDNVLQPGSKDPGADDTRAFRSELAFDQGGDFKANYIFTYFASEGGSTAANLSVISDNLRAALVPGTYVVGGGRLDTFALDQQSTADNEIYMHNLTLEYAVSDNFTAKAITGYRKYDNANYGPDLDGNGPILANIAFGGGVQPVNLFFAKNKRQQEQFSQELQLIGEWTKRFKYVVGGYFFVENGSERNPQRFFVPGPIPAFGIPLGQGIISSNPFAFNTETDSWATFGQATYTPPILGDRLSLTGGLRYTEDTKFTELLQSDTVFLPLRGSNKQSFNNLSYSATIDFKWTDSVLTYFRHSTGYKAGGFNTRSTSLAPYQEETIEAYEAGLKAEWFDRHLQTNLAIFYNKARNQQVAQFVAGASGATNIVTNAGKSHYQGIELEILATPVEGVMLNMNFGYIDPQYDQYKTLDPATLIPVDVARNADFGYTSEITASAGIQYDSRPISWIGGGKFKGRIDVLYQSFQTFHPAIVYPSGARDNPLIDLVKGDARTIVNGRIAFQEIPMGGTGATLELALWGKNILDEAYVISGIEFGSLGFGEDVYGPPRTGGIEAIFRY